MKHILVVEDDNDVRDCVAEILSLASYDVGAVRNGKEGIDEVHRRVSDLIISDINMPVLDGIGMLRILRNDPATVGIPFIFLTSRSERFDFRNAMDAGADDYITKPFNGDELLKAVENRFKRDEALKKNNAAAKVNGSGNDKEDDPKLEILTANRDTHVFLKKQVIYRENSVPRLLYFIVGGKVRTYKTAEDGKQLVTGLYAAGDFLGYIPLLREASYEDTAEAMEETEVAVIPKKDFETLLHKNATVQARLIKMLANNVAEHEDLLINIAYGTLRKKVAFALHQLAAKYGKANEQRYTIDIMRNDLASIAGVATESLIRTLADFRIEKIVEINPKNNKITIVNAAKLEKTLAES